MPNIEIAKPGSAPASRPRDVFDAMRQEMNRLLEHFESGGQRWPSLFGRRGGGVELVVPELDVRESSEGLAIEAELPGVDEKDVSVTLAGGILTIKGEKKQEREEKSDNYHLAERSFGAFERSLHLPDTVDDSKVEARFEKGVLKITAAKKPEAVKAERKIDIKKS